MRYYFMYLFQAGSRSGFFEGLNPNVQMKILRKTTFNAKNIVSNSETSFECQDKKNKKLEQIQSKKQL